MGCREKDNSGYTYQAKKSDEYIYKIIPTRIEHEYSYAVGEWTPSPPLCIDIHIWGKTKADTDSIMRIGAEYAGHFVREESEDNIINFDNWRWETIVLKEGIPIVADWDRWFSVRASDSILVNDMETRINNMIKNNSEQFVEIKQKSSYFYSEKGFELEYIKFPEDNNEK
jgi:hypothetical protein